MLDILKSDITAIQLNRDFRYCSIFNIYNYCTNNNTTNALELYLNTNLTTVLPHPSDHMFWFSDFNRHHPLWEEDKNHWLFNNNNLITPLLDLINEYEMVLTLPPGIPTYKTATGNWMRLDNVLHSNNQSNPIITCNVKLSMYPPCTDHLLIITELNLSVTQATSSHTCNLHQANFALINDKLQDKIDLIGPVKRLHRKEEINTSVNNLVQAIRDIINKVVRPSKPSPYVKR